MQPSEGFSEDLKTYKYRICYNEVNIRAEPDSNSEIVGEMYLGESIELTGHYIDYPAYDIYSRWYETTDGTWIVSDAVCSYDEYNRRF